jgi:DNA-directed RNA polymerase subunit alpha
MDFTGNVQTLLQQEPFDETVLQNVRNLAFASDKAMQDFDSLVNQRMQGPDAKQPAGALRIGLSLCVLGRFEDALPYLEKAQDAREKFLYLGRVQRTLRNYTAAKHAFDKAGKAGLAPGAVAVEHARTQIAAGEFDAADKILQGVAQADRAADWHVAHAKILEARGQRRDAIAVYEQALDLDHTSTEATFRLAYLADLEGDDDQAIDYYESLVGTGPVHVHALLNLAVIYEDRDQYDKAEDCIDKVLAIWPAHERARLFLKDILASRDMVIDEDVERFREKRSALFDVAITDFELSVRARNCLQSMGINTLGDLLRINEEQLLAYKNFGETSLDEIKQLLTSKGLRLGQSLEEERKARQQEILKQVQGDPAILVKPVAELQLSVRARKALQRLNIQTIGELAARTESELLGVKNFGQTSLNEIRQRLGEYGLTLRKA